MRTILSLIILIAFATIPFSVNALSVPTPGSNLIGGKIIFTLRCTCNLNPLDRLIFVAGPKPGTFLKHTMTKVYDNKNLSIGANVVGEADGGLFGSGSCKLGFPPTCTPFSGSFKKIKQIGTS